MILVEECKLRLDDPVDRWLPELADRQVLRAIDGPLDDTVPAKRADHAARSAHVPLGYGMLMAFPDRYPIQQAIAEAGFAPGPVFPSFPPDEWMRRYGSLPLMYQPGERWLYNTGTRNPGRADRARCRADVRRIPARAHLRAARHEGHRRSTCRRPSIDRFATSYMRDHATQELEVFDDPVDRQVRAARRCSKPAARDWSRPPTISMPSRR